MKNTHPTLRLATPRRGGPDVETLFRQAALLLWAVRRTYLDLAHCDVAGERFGWLPAEARRRASALELVLQLADGDVEGDTRTPLDALEARLPRLLAVAGRLALEAGGPDHDPPRLAG